MTQGRTPGTGEDLAVAPGAGAEGASEPRLTRRQAALWIVVIRHGLEVWADGTGFAYGQRNVGPVHPAWEEGQRYVLTSWGWSHGSHATLTGCLEAAVRWLDAKERHRRRTGE